MRMRIIIEHPDIFIRKAEQVVDLRVQLQSWQWSIFSAELLSGLLYWGAALGVAPWALRDFGARRRTRSVEPKARMYLFGAAFFGGVGIYRSRDDWPVDSSLF